jgi:hypothetical protein
MELLATQIFDSFKSFFAVPDIGLGLVLIALAIALVFSAIWIAAFYPNIVKDFWAWIILIAGFIFTAILTAFLQIPLQYGSTKILDTFLSHQNMVTYMLIVSIPALIIAAIIQVGARLLPVVIYWLSNKRTLEPKTALMLGAFAGAGIGIVQALQLHCSLLYVMSQIQPVGVFVIFLESFLTVGFNICTIAIASYGMAKGKWWQYSLVVAALYFVFNYITQLMNLQILGPLFVEIIIVILALLTAAAALWLRWRKPAKQVETA